MPTLFRPPGGWYDDELVQQAREQPCGWSHRASTRATGARNWVRRTSDEVLSHVEPGSIVLLHDGGGGAEHTIRALPAIIRGVRKRGLVFVTVPAHP